MNLRSEREPFPYRSTPWHLVFLDGLAEHGDHTECTPAEVSMRGGGGGSEGGEPRGHEPRAHP